MNSEVRAASTLLLYAATLTLAMVLAILHASRSVVEGVLAFGMCVTIIWGVGPTVLRLLSSGKH